MLVEKYGWAIQKSLFAETNQDSTFSHTRENSKMFDITSKYFRFFNNLIENLSTLAKKIARIWRLSGSYFPAFE